MLNGFNFIGLTECNEGDQSLLIFSTITGSVLPEKFFIATSREINNSVLKAEIALRYIKKLSAK